MVSQSHMEKAIRLLKIMSAVLMIGLLICWLVSRGSQQRDISLACEIDSLAPLPADAADVHAASIHSLTWVSAFVKFRASATSIETFLAASPGLRGTQAEYFTHQHMYLPHPKRSPGPDLASYARNAYFLDYARVYHLPWFDRTIRSMGRRYLIRSDADNVLGEVVVDDAHHVVYIYADKE